MVDNGFDFCLMDSPLGQIKIVALGDFLTEVEFFTEESPLPEKSEQATLSPIIQECRAQLTAYFSGTLKAFDLPLKPSGTDFQKEVWRALQEIPFGKAISYLTLSKRLGNVKAIRAVGHANGQNPLAIIVPCHRVIGSDGSLTGYAGGLWRKKWLLQHEGVLSQKELFPD